MIWSSSSLRNAPPRYAAAVSAAAVLLASTREECQTLPSDTALVNRGQEEPRPAAERTALRPVTTKTSVKLFPGKHRRSESRRLLRLGGLFVRADVIHQHLLGEWRRCVR